MGVRNTSRQAFHSLNNLGKKQQLVYDVLLKSRSLCNIEIANRLNMPINSITPRVNELVAMGYVEESHRAVNPITNRRSIYWRVNIGQAPLFWRTDEE